MLADLSPVPAIRKAALRINRMTSERRTLKLVRECHRLLSVRAEANSPAIAQNIIGELDELNLVVFVAAGSGTAELGRPTRAAVGQMERREVSLHRRADQDSGTFVPAKAAGQVAVIGAAGQLLGDFGDERGRLSARRTTGEAPHD